MSKLTIYYTMQVGDSSPTCSVTDTYPTGLRIYEPEKVKDIKPQSYGLHNKSHHYGYNYCPAYTDFLHNLYAFKCPIDYSLHLDLATGMVGTKHYSQNEFNKFINVRSLDDKLFSFYVTYSFYADTESLPISQMPAFLENNSFVDNTVLIPGTFDVVKWPRPISCAFHMKTNSLDFNEGDILFYTKFHTDRNIEFKYFVETDRLRQLKTMVINSKNLKSKVKNLNFYYDLFFKKKKLYRLMLDEVKSNVID